MRQYHLAEFQEHIPQTHDQVAQPVRPASSACAQPKYQTSSLKDEEMHDILHKITRLFGSEYLYTDTDLTLHDLAKQLDVTTHNISQTINSKAQQSFSDFVNAYRVEHLKQLLTDPTMQGYTILALGMESGFNSKSSLNRVFKQHTGMTPGAFRRTQLEVPLTLELV